MRFSVGCMSSDPGSIDADYQTFIQKYPGQVYSADEQCKLIEGTGATVCSVRFNNTCRVITK